MANSSETGAGAASAAGRRREATPGCAREGLVRVPVSAGFVGVLVGRLGNPQQLLDGGLAARRRGEARWQTASACPPARAASAIFSAAAPSLIRRSSSGFIVSTSTMLNRPR